MFELNFPKTQQVAKETADKRVEAMLDALQKSFAKQKEQLDPRKFEEPAMQFEMQAMAIDAAREGEKSNVDLLCELFCTMKQKDCPELIELIAAEARKVLPNLSPKHVSYLSLEVLVNEVALTAPNLLTVNHTVAQTLNHISNCSQVTQSDLRYISVSGAIVARGITHIGVTPSFINAIPELKGKKLEEIIEFSKKHDLNSFVQLQDLITKLHIGNFQLTAV